MEDKISFSTPENWAQFLRGLELHKLPFGNPVEISAAHLHNPSLQGVYTEYRSFLGFYDESKKFGYRVHITSGGEGRIMGLDSVAPVIIPNPVFINFKDLCRESVVGAIESSPIILPSP